MAHLGSNAFGPHRPLAQGPVQAIRAAVPGQEDERDPDDEDLSDARRQEKGH